MAVDQYDRIPRLLRGSRLAEPPLRIAHRLPRRPLPVDRAWAPVNAASASSLRAQTAGVRIVTLLLAGQQAWNPPTPGTQGSPRQSTEVAAPPTQSPTCSDASGFHRLRPAWPSASRSLVHARRSAPGERSLPSGINTWTGCSGRRQASGWAAARLREFSPVRWVLIPPPWTGAVSPYAGFCKHHPT